MPRRLRFPILLLLVTGSAAATSVPEPGDGSAPSAARTEEPVDLFWVRSMALVENRARPAQSEEAIREALTRWLPDAVQMSTDGADLLVDYRSTLSAKEIDRSDLHLWIEDVGFDVPGDAPRAEPRVAASGEKYRVWWIADLYRLDCQSPRFGEKPTPAIDGHCQSRVYVRVKLGTMQGTADDRASALESFAARLREALLRSP